VLGVYPEANYPAQPGYTSAFLAAVDCETDFAFKCDGRRTARAYSSVVGAAPVYKYFFTRHPPGTVSGWARNLLGG